MKFTTIVTSEDPNTCNTVMQFFNSTTDVTQTNPNTMNVYSKKYNHVALAYLATTADGTYDQTKAKYWFLAATGQDTRG